MSTNSAIEWTDATWNPVRGCVKVSPGCKHCYAETFAERFRGVPGHPYEQGFDLRLVPDKLTEPLSWKKPRRVFVNSMSDLFQDGVPDTYILDVFLTMEKCPQHTFQVLTKRADRMREVVSWLGRKWADCGDKFPLANVWLGVSVENQHFADERIPLLLQTPAAVRFISAEPLLGPIDLAQSIHAKVLRFQGEDTPFWPERWLDWVIVGGESGHGARPFDLAWARSIVAQCRAAGVACFVKQLGARPIFPSGGSWEFKPIDPYHGGKPEDWPADLRVREFPQVTRGATET